MLSLEQVRRNHLEVQRRVRAAQERGGWQHEVKLVVATKYVSLEDMEVLRAAGITLVGENRVDGLRAKWQRYGSTFEFHFIGHLQTRKVRRVLPLVTMIQSVDSLRLVAELDNRAERPIDALLEVNVSGEESKYGIFPADAEAFLDQAARYPAVRFTGLMTLAPFTHDPEEVRPVFRQLRELRDRLAPVFASRYQLKELSMGMSNDYEVAVEEGATIIRLGSALIARA